MSGHTPGPWKVSEIDPHCVETSARGYWFSWAHLPHQHEKYGINPEADAMLIAAAPELLDAVKQALDHEYNPFERTNQSRRYLRLRELIFRATGEQP